MKNEIQLRPSYWASVSGGKDSLYMLKLILSHPEQYPLDGVVHFELEIDYPFIHDVVDYMESECKKHGIRFVRIKPRKTWLELYNTVPNRKKENVIYDGLPNLFPSRSKRWCNADYKLDAKKQLVEFLKQQGSYLVQYIGYCADEVKRYEKRKPSVKEIYPLVQYGINEDLIWAWAKHQPIFNNYYKTQRRCGCMYCPITSKLNMAYTLKYYPEQYEFMMDKARQTETLVSKKIGRAYTVFSSDNRYTADYIDNIVRTKYLHKLEELETVEQITIYDFIEQENEV